MEYTARGQVQWLVYLLEQKAMGCGASSAGIFTVRTSFSTCSFLHVIHTMERVKSRLSHVQVNPPTSPTLQPLLPSSLSYPPTSPTTLISLLQGWRTAGRNISLKYTMKHLDKVVNKNPHLILEPKFLFPMILVPSYQFLENGSASHIG